MLKKHKDLVILEDEFKAASSKLVLMTDDGSYCEKGFVTDALRKLIESGEQYDEVIAQRDELLNVSYAKIQVNIAGMKETLIRTVEYQLYDYNNIPIENDNIRAATRLIQVTMPVKTVKEVPLLLNFVEAVGSTLQQVEYTIDPSVVRLKGDQAILNSIDSIVLDTIYLQDLEETQTLRYRISVPDGTEVVGEITEITVTVTVRGVSERRVTTANFVCSNVPQGFNVAVTTESLSVTLRGLTEEIGALTGEDLLITADLSSITEAGTYTVPVGIQVNGYQNVGIKGSYQVIVAVEPAVDPAPQARILPEAPADGDDQSGSEGNDSDSLLPSA